jgi:hypothetical protein
MARSPLIIARTGETEPVAGGMGLLAPGALRMPEPAALPLPEAIDVEINANGPVDGVTIDPQTGAAQIELDDGGVLIDLNPDVPGRDKDSGFGANLAEQVAEGELARIAEDVIRGVESDLQSRKEWEETRAQGIRLLGLRIEDPQTAGADASTAVAGQSTVRHPLLLESTLRFQANARGELLPAGGPVKVSDKIDESGRNDELAEALEADFNYYLTSVATEYYPDTDRLLLYVGFGGCGFKKVYNCPIRRRPVSESVDAKDFVVSNAVTDIRNSARVTHIITMRPSMLKRMQLAGAYRDVPVIDPNPSLPNAVDRQIAETQGIDNQNQLAEDRDHTIYEVYCELDLGGYEDKDKSGKPTGLALPYRVVVDRDSRQVLEIRRNWDEKDERKLAKLPFVKYPFVPGLGFYDIGFVHILGNTTNALTAAWREMLDAGMFANFPGFIYAKLAGRQNTNEFRVPPGGGVGLETNGQDIRQAVMPLPYKDVSPAFTAFLTQISETGQRVGGTAEMNVGEGNQQAPVGTTLALIEQATKIEGAVHKRLHAAQAEEFQLLKQCFREDPSSFIESVKRKGSFQWDEAKFLAALDDASIVPMADPNTPSHMHRLMKAMAIKQLQAAQPALYDPKAVDERVLHMIGVEDADQLFAKQPAQQPDPKLLETQMKGQQQAQKLAAQAAEIAVKERMQQRESQDQAADRQTRLQIAGMHLQEAALDHRDDMAEAQAGLVQ